MSAITKRLIDITEETNAKLARFTHDSMHLRIDGVESMLLSDVAATWGDSDAPVCSVGMELSSDPMLKLLILLTPQARGDIASCMLGNDAPIEEEMADSILQELGNIFGTAIVNSLAVDLGIEIRTSAPETAKDMPDSLISAVLASMPDIGDHVLFLNSQLQLHGSSLECQVYLFLDNAPSWQALITQPNTTETDSPAIRKGATK